MSPGGDHDYLNKGAMVVAGIYLFFMTERLLKTLMHWRKVREQKTQLWLIANLNLQKEKKFVSYLNIFFKL